MLERESIKKLQGDFSKVFVERLEKLIEKAGRFLDKIWFERYPRRIPLLSATQFLQLIRESRAVNASSARASKDGAIVIPSGIPETMASYDKRASAFRATKDLTVNPRHIYWN